MDMEAHGMPVGFFPDAEYDPAAVQIPPASRVYVFSDGCYEIRKSGGEARTREEMIRYLNTLPPDPLLQLEGLYQHLIRVQGGERLDDDFSMVCATFP